MMNQSASNAVRAVVVILVLVVCSPVAAAAQTATGQSKPAGKQWSISLGVGAATGGPARQLEGAMRSAGFDDPSLSPGDLLLLLLCVFCDLSQFEGSDPNPASSGVRSVTEFDVTFRRSDRLALGVILHRSDLGRTRGRQSPHMLFVDSETTVLAPMAYLRLGDRVRIGAGPLAAWTEASSTDAWGLAPEKTPSSHKSLTGGAIVSATLETRPRGRIYFALNASHRWILPVTVGPFTATGSTSSATVPAFRARFGHSSLGISLGVRF